MLNYQKPQVVSETFPVKFQKLTDGVIRPKIAEVKSEGFKIKERSAHESKNSRDDTSKVKVVYIDPLTTEEDEIIKGLSVDSIISHKLEGNRKVNPSTLLAYIMNEDDNKNSNTNSGENQTRRPHPASSRQSESRGNYSNASFYGDRSRMYSPKLKVNPVHSSAGHKVGNLRIMSANAGHTPRSQDVSRNGRAPRKLTPAARPLLRTSTGQGSSVKAGPLKGEPEYIKIISQLKIKSSSAPAASLLPPQGKRSDLLPPQVVKSDPGQISPGRNSPEDLNYIFISNEAQSPSAPPEGPLDDQALAHTNNTSSGKPSPTPSDDGYHGDSDLLIKENDSEDVEFCAVATSPATTPVAPSTTPPATFPTVPATNTSATFPITAAISIPTGDEEFSSHLLPLDRDNDDSSDLNN
ncbi:unnamed protein product [Candidula unifasciata]|uniref:Uncharacterized protein n=1 Tax=Candidula unifasciata TaxID=100452 RepID=A0A8S3YJ58_9EUPU|nr:unnamed protein product [Candidula unifasciata]